MNLSILKAFFDRLSVRTKLIGMAIIAFLLGTFFGGRGGSEGSGRYVPFNSVGGNSMATLDTRSGQVWIVDAEGQNYRKGPKIPYW